MSVSLQGRASVQEPGAAVRYPRLVGGQTIQAPTRGPDAAKPFVRQQPGSVDRPGQAPRQIRTRSSRAFMRPHVRSQVTRVQPRTPCSSSLLHLERHEPRRGRRRLQARRDARVARPTPIPTLLAGQYDPARSIGRQAGARLSRLPARGGGWLSLHGKNATVSLAYARVRRQFSCIARPTPYLGEPDCRPPAAPGSDRPDRACHHAPTRSEKCRQA